MNRRTNNAVNPNMHSVKNKMYYSIIQHAFSPKTQSKHKPLSFARMFT